MIDELGRSLFITLIGMGLVMGFILMFWGLMSVLVRLGGNKAAGSHGNLEDGTATEVEELQAAHKRRAAVAAVAVALTLRSSEGPRPFPLPPTALVSTWQAVLRSRQMEQSGRRR